MWQEESMIVPTFYINFFSPKKKRTSESNKPQMLLLPKVTRVLYKSDEEEKHSWKKDMNIAGVKGQARADQVSVALAECWLRWLTTVLMESGWSIREQVLTLLKKVPSYFSLPYLLFV